VRFRYEGNNERRMTDDPTMQRLEDQIAWYDQRSDRNRRAVGLDCLLFARAFVERCTKRPVFV
jgi:hypothetical protein